MIEYATDLFDGPTVAAIGERFVRLRRSSLQSDASGGWISSHRKNTKPSCGGATTGAPGSGRHLAGAVRGAGGAQAGNRGGGVRRPERNYAQLDARANQLAHHLRSLGVGPEIVVGLCVERSLDMVVELLGILKAGGAYLPLDPSYPAERLAFMLADAEASTLVAHSGTRDRLPMRNVRVVDLDRDEEAIAACLSVVPVSSVGPGNLAYVIYTSGSTGNPKGVMGTHRVAVGRLDWDMASEDSPHVYAQKTSLSFVDFIWELFMPLSRGQRLVLIADGEVRFPWLSLTTFPKTK